VRCSHCASPDRANSGRSVVRRCFITQISISSLYCPLTFRITMHDRFAFSLPILDQNQTIPSGRIGKTNSPVPVDVKSRRKPSTANPASEIGEPTADQKVGHRQGRE